VCQRRVRQRDGARACVGQGSARMCQQGACGVRHESSRTCVGRAASARVPLAVSRVSVRVLRVLSRVALSHRPHVRLVRQIHQGAALPILRQRARREAADCEQESACECRGVCELAVCTCVTCMHAYVPVRASHCTHTGGAARRVRRGAVSESSRGRLLESAAVQPLLQRRAR
jgi:hypothetical protein